MTDNSGDIKNTLAHAKRVIEQPLEEAGDSLNLALSQLPLNDVGNGERLRRRFCGKMLYVREVGWHYWDGARWCASGGDEQVRMFAQSIGPSIWEEIQAFKDTPPDLFGSSPHDWLERLSKWSVASGNKQRIEAMIKEATPHITVSPTEMDGAGREINLQNGTLELSGACDNLRPHAPQDLNSKIATVSFKPDATCPQFNRFIARIMPDEEVQLFLQTWMGYNLMADTIEQKLVFFYGEGANGKSVFVDLMAKMLGNYATSLPFSSLVRDDRRRGAEATPDLARLVKARYVRASEPEAGSRLSESTIKLATGGEEMSVRHLNKGFFDFKPEFKFNISGNHKPSIRGQDYGIWRRVLLVPWQVVIPEAEQDRFLPDKLWAERDGIFNWVLDGARLWLEDGLKIPKAILDATQEYRDESDPIGRFLNDCVEKYDAVMGQYRISASEMYAIYSKWCRGNAVHPSTMTGFGRALSDRGFEKEKGRVVHYVNLRFKQGVLEEYNDDPPPHDEVPQ